MRDTDKPESFPLGRPVKPPEPPASAPIWKPVPGHPQHETDGKDIRLKPGVLVSDALDSLFGLPDIFRGIKP